MLTQYSKSWFLSKTGRKVTCYCMCALSGGIIVGHYVPHTYLVSQYVDLIHAYRSGFKEKLSNKVLQRFEKSVDLLKPSELQKANLHTFTVLGLDLYRAGTTSSRFGAHIGIPKNFEYDSDSDVEKDDLQVNQKAVDWSSEMGQKLSESLVLSEPLQIFGICREILMSHTPLLYFKTAIGPQILFIIYICAQKLNVKFNLYQGPPIFRYAVYCCLTLLGLGIYFMFKDMLNVYYEGKTDEKLCELGPEYIKIGIEFYDKTLQRNIALRNLMGEKGESMYTIKGNENYILRSPSLPLVLRKQYFEKKLKEYEEKLEQTDSYE